MRVAVLGEPRDWRAASAFLEGVARWVEMVPAGGAAPAADGWILLDPAAEPPRLPGGVVVWRSGPRLPPETAGSALVVAVTAPGGPAPAGATPFPWPGTDVRARLHLTPLLRCRWRRAVGLPARLASDLWEMTGTPDPERVTRILLSSAVAARGEGAVTALASGAPLVTDRATASRLGLRDGDQALVVPGSRRAAALEELASDGVRAARLSRLGRRHAEGWFDHSRAVNAAVNALRGQPPPALADVLGRALAELWTPRRAAAVSGVAHRVGSLQRPAAGRPGATFP